MTKIVLFMAMVMAQITAFSAEDTPVGWEKIDAVDVSTLSIRIDLTKQVLYVLQNNKSLCSSPCTTAPIELKGDDGKPFVYPASTKIIAVGKGKDGMRISTQFGTSVEMPNFLSLDMSLGGKNRGVGIHGSAWSTVPRSPSSRGCIRLPNWVASKLFFKLTSKGELIREVKVEFVGAQEPLWH